MQNKDQIPQMHNLYSEQGLGAIPLKLGRTLSANHVIVIEEFPSPGSKELDENNRPLALQYPGKRPETSFSLVNGKVNAVTVGAEGESKFYINTSTESDEELVYDLLASAEAAPMSERYPVIAFGSNANPGQLAQKFQKLEGAEKHIVPTMMATVKGVVPVYSARIGINGYVFTDLAPAGDDVESKVHINFLSKAQLEAMDATEKAYSLCQISNVKLETGGPRGRMTDAYLYVGREDNFGADILKDEQGRLIRLSEIKAVGDSLEQSFGTMSQAEVQHYIFEIAGSRIAECLQLPELPTSEIDLIKMILNRENEPRLKALRSSIEQLEPDQPLGRVVGRQIQRAISQSGMTTQTSGLRKTISEELRNVSLEDAQTFSALNLQ